MDAGDSDTPVELTATRLDAAAKAASDHVCNDPAAAGPLRFCWDTLWMVDGRLAEATREFWRGHVLRILAAAGLRVIRRK